MSIADHLAKALEAGLTLPATLIKQAANTGNGMHFLDRDGNSRDLSYAALCQQAGKAAQRLCMAGLTPGQAVIVCCDDEYDLILAFWAILFANGVAIPLSAPASYSASDEGLNKIIAVYRQCEQVHGMPPLIISDLDLVALDNIPVWHQTIAPLQCHHPAAIFDDQTPDQSIDQILTTYTTLPLSKSPEALAMLMFSSGSTGDPKGVRLTHRQLLSNLQQIAERSHIGQDERSLSWLPLTHDMGLVLFHLCHTLAGIEQYKTTPLTFARDPAGFLDLASRLHIHILGMPNFGFDQLMRVAASEINRADAAANGRSPRWQLASVRVIFNGAEPIDPQLCRRFVDCFAPFGLAPWVISPGWGIAEASVTASAFDQHYLEKLGHFPSLWIDADCLMAPGSTIIAMVANAEGAREIAALGQPMRGMVIRVLNDEGEILPPSHLGHLEFSGPNVCHGYFGQADMTWCKSGDLGFIHEGLVYITGRAKDILFINGRNHYSNDLELALTHALDWPANQLAVVGITNNVHHREQIVIFFRQPRHGDHLAQARQLRTALETLLAYPVAAAIGIAALPKTTSGKIRRFALRQALVRGDYDHEFDFEESITHQPLNTTENRVFGLMCELFPELPDNIDPLLPLSRYGFDSVAYMQLAFRASNTFERVVTPYSLLKAASLSRIAQEIEQAPPSEKHSAPLAQRVFLTPRQTMLWTAWQIAPDSAAYNENYWLQFTATLDPDIWLEATRKVLARHSMLNAVIEEAPDADTPPNLCLRENLRADIGIGIAEDESSGAGPMPVYEHGQALELMHNLAHRPFDLRHGPLIRIRLLKHTNDGWYLFLSAHHIIIDGWSLQLLISQIFEACTTGSLPPKAEGLWLDPQSFDDASVAQWLEKIKNKSEVLHLPAEVAQPTQGHTHIHSQLLPAMVFDAIQTWQADGMGHPFSILSGALLVLLARLANIERPLMATVASGRMDAAAEHRIGYYAQTLPMIADIDPVAGFDSLINQIEHQRHAILHGKTPDLATLSSSTDASLAAAIRVVYVHQNTPALMLPEGWTAIKTGQLRESARVDLYVTSSRFDQTLKLDWEYDSGKFSASQISGWAELFEHVLLTLFRAPTQAIGKLSLLSPQQRTLWKPWQDSARAVDFSQNIINRFELAARTWPDYPAISDTGARYSYATLAHKVDALCHLLTDAGLVYGARVCLLTERSAEYVMALLASLKVGAIVVPIDPALPQERINQIATDSGATLLLTTPGVALPSALSEHYPVLCFSAVELQPGQPWHGPQLAFDDSAYLIFTSGSTGKSKGVLNTHRCLINLVDWVVSAFAYQPGETICQFAPFSFDVSIAEILPSLCCGLHIHVLPSERRNSPDLYLQTILEQKVNIATLTPAYLAVLNEIPDRCRQALGSLRLMILGGEALKTDEVRLFRQHSPHVRIVNVYGPTETTVLSTAYPVPQELDLSRPWQPLGLPIANTEIWLLDEHDRVCPATLTGTLYIAGDGLGRGYWQDPEKTDAAFRMLAPGGGQPRRFYCSGDLARLSSSGLLEFVGRADNQIKLRGFRIELGEIEATLERHEKVVAAVVKAVARDDGDRVLVACYSGDPVPAIELDGFLRSSLPNYMVPAFFQHVTTWPLTTNRKTDRQRLPQPGWEKQTIAMGKYGAPQDATELALANLWGRFFPEAGTIGREHNFFDLGAHSLQAIKLVLEIKDHFHKEISLQTLFKHPVLKDLAQQIQAGNSRQHHAIPHVPEASCHPTSPAQQRLFFLCELSQSPDIIYNIPLVYHFKGDIDIALWQANLLQLVRRHEALRTRFIMTDGTLRQVIGDLSLFHPEIQHRAHQSEADCIAEFVRPFNLRQDCLFRARIICFNDMSGGMILFDFHHIICDGVSINIAINDLSAMFAGQDLPAVPVQYKDYCHWLEDNPETTQDLDYWIDHLQDAPTLDLKTDFVRPDQQSFAGGEVRFSLDHETGLRFSAFCKVHQITPYMAYLGIVSILLAKLAGQEDVVIGSPVAGRVHGDLKSTMGMFVGSMPIRCRPAGQHRFSDYLQEIRQICLAAIDHQNFQFDELVRRVVSGIDPSRNPVFDCMLDVQIAEPEALKVTDLELTPVALNNPNAKMDLMFNISDSTSANSAAINVVIGYAKALFKHETIEVFAECFQTLLRDCLHVASLDDPRCLKQLQLLAPHQRQQLLAGFNLQTTPPQADSRLIHQVFEAQVKARPEATALIHDGQRISYHELNRRANQLAHHLLGHGVRADDRVVICMERCPQMIVALLAILKAGAAYVPIDPNYPPARMQHILGDSTPTLLLTLTGLQSNLPVDSLMRILLDDDVTLSAIASRPEDNPDPVALGLTSRHLAYVIYTSGSTGKAKGVMIEHHSVIGLCIDNHFARFTPEDCVSHCANPAFDASVLEIWGALLNGASLHIIPQPVLLDPLALKQFLMSSPINIMWMTIGLFHEYADLLHPVFSRFKYIMTGGDVIDPRVVRRVLEAPNAPRHFLHCYGPTETTVFTTTFEVTQVDDASPIPLGRAVGGLQVVVLDENGQLLPPCVAGEIHIKGSGVGRGYLNLPELTQERFIEVELTEGRIDRLYKTGDMGRLRADGNLEFLGRNDFQVKIRGFRIEPGEIESRLIQCANVRGALVMAKPTPQGDKQLVAYLLAAPEVHLDIAILRKELAGKLVDFMLPAAFVVMNSFPLNANGKLDRRAFPEPDWQVRNQNHIAPRTPTEAALASIWRDILKQEDVGIHDSFFELGGHSLLAARLMSLIEVRLSQKLALKRIFDNPTIAGLALLLDAAGNTASAEATADNPANIGNIVHEPARISLDTTRLAQLMTLAANSPSGHQTTHRQVLLTGATGFVGAFLLQQILQSWEGDAVCHCPVRANSAQQAFERIRATLSQYGLWQDAWAGRIIAIPADLAQPGLGIDASTWHQLAHSLDFIVHNGAIVNHALPYTDMVAANVDSTLFLLNLAATAKPKQFAFVSTGDIFSTLPGRTQVDETSDILAESHVEQDGYQASKWQAECLVNQAKSNGLDARIFRLGRVAADSKHGMGRLDDIIARYLGTCLILGSYPDMPFYETIIPVDAVATAIIRLCAQPPETNNTWHLIGTQKIDWQHCLELSAAHDTHLQRMNPQQWYKLAVQAESQGQNLPFAPYLQMFDPTQAPQKHCTILHDITISKLGELNYSIPHMARQEFEKYIGNIVRHFSVKYATVIPDTPGDSNLK